MINHVVIAQYYKFIMSENITVIELGLLEMADVCCFLSGLCG